jgi:hypothetical protein
MATPSVAILNHGPADLGIPRVSLSAGWYYPRSTCLRRVLIRTIIGGGRTRSDLAEGCPDRFDIAFLSYVWNFPLKQRPRITGGIAQFGSDLRVVRLACDREVENFLTTLAR